MINFKQYLNEWKHVGENSCFCGHCNKNLKAVDIIIGKHMYPIGQLLVCSCKKSRIFTNTIRDVKDFIDYCEGRTKNYFDGFCNDKKCGYCFAYLNPILNGVPVPNTEYRADQYGCVKKCSDNQNLLLVGQNNLPEGEETTKLFVDFYKNHLELVKKLYESL